MIAAGTSAHDGQIGSSWLDQYVDIALRALAPYE
jgi:hypothetical protein